MGLDMYLYKRKKRGTGKEEKEVAYWRKANAIHSWMERNLNGVGNLTAAPISIRKIKKLKKVVDDVLEDNSKAETLLPTAEGFFWGGLNYDDYYYYYLKYTSDIFDKIIKEHKPGDKYYYYPWW